MSIHLLNLNLLIILLIQGTIEEELAELKQQVKELQENIALLTNELHEIKDFNEFNSVCPKDWITYLDSKCFKFYEESQTEIESKERCKQLAEKSTLVTILSNEEQIFLSNNMKNYSEFSDKIWIGLELKNNSYQWLDGSEYNFTNWHANAAQKGDCVLMSLLKASLGKWSDESCNKRYSSVCQKRLSKQSRIIQKILNLTADQNEIENQQGEINNQIESQNNEILDIYNTLEDHYDQINSMIPIGFLYIQLPHQSPPQGLWPNMTWIEITSVYSGLFFRAEGGESENFGFIQQANQSWISEAYYWGCNIQGGIDCVLRKVPFNRETWSTNPDIFPGKFGFYTTGGEIRPKNTAIKIFKRIK